jgi:hypothetical protein
MTDIDNINTINSGNKRKEVIAKETEKNTKSTQNNYLLFF